MNYLQHYYFDKVVHHLNYKNKLTSQHAPHSSASIKVVYPASVKRMKAAIVRGTNLVVDTKLYYYNATSEEEAYYLCTLLNTPCLAADLQRKASTGFQGIGVHIHKRVFDYPIPTFTPEEPLHRTIAQLGKEIELCVAAFVGGIREKGDLPAQPLQALQKQLYRLPKFTSLLEQINPLLLRLMREAAKPADSGTS